MGDHVSVVVKVGEWVAVGVMVEVGVVEGVTVNTGVWVTVAEGSLYNSVR